MKNLQMNPAWRQSPKWVKFGWVLGRLIGWPARFVGHPNSLLVILSGSLGDALLFSGALREIRRAVDGRHIVLVVPERMYPFLARCPHVDEILATPMDAGIWQRLVRIAHAVRVFSHRYDRVLCPAVMRGEDSELMAYLAIARRRTLMEWRSAALLPENSRDALKIFAPAAAQDLHELDRTVLFLQAAGFDGIKSRKDIWPETYVTEDERTGARREIGELRLKVPDALVVAVCTGARFKQKDWGTANFIELLWQLAQTGPLVVILLGGGDDESVADAIEAGMGDISTVCVLNKAGRTSLHASIALIEQADLCIGNDTFGLHAAIAVGTPSIVVMWGGDNERWAPWGDPIRHRMVRSRDQTCFGCRGKCIHEEYRCMASISVNDVLSEVLTLLHRES